MTILKNIRLGAVLSGGISVLAVASSWPSCWAQEAAPNKLTVTISGGHETWPQDRGRPVVLVAGALGVPAQVFRNAFSTVRPAPNGTRPDPHQVGLNKQALLSVLAPYGITNERLDQVSDYYRYNPSAGGLWHNESAAAYAVQDAHGNVSIKITNPGSGYSSLPLITIAGRPDLEATAMLVQSRDFSKNGSIQTITLRKRLTQ